MEGIKSKVNKEEVLKNVSIPFFFIFIIIVSHSMIIYSVPLSQQCELKYGTNWYNGIFVGEHMCAKVNYNDGYNITMIIKPIPSVEEIKEIKEKYCNPPRFYELNRWDNGCPKNE